MVFYHFAAPHIVCVRTVHRTHSQFGHSIPLCHVWGAEMNRRIKVRRPTSCLPRQPPSNLSCRVKGATRRYLDLCASVESWSRKRERKRDRWHHSGRKSGFSGPYILTPVPVLPSPCPALTAARPYIPRSRRTNLDGAQGFKTCIGYNIPQPGIFGIQCVMTPVWSSYQGAPCVSTPTMAMP
jgi:hypothetical protein